MSIFHARPSIRGFTLVELLGSVAVIGILATIVYAAMGEVREKARDTERISEIEQLRLALRLYNDQRGTYPDDPSYNGGVVIGEGGALDAELAPLTAGTMSDPLGSASDNEYEYVYDPQFDCLSVNRIVLYAKSMEKPTNSNWSDICGTPVGGGMNTYGVILR